MALLAPRKPDEDLFAETTMTFGEHLEELRVCLWRAVLGLMIGFLIGLSVGKQAVNLIQRPLENALRLYYDQLAIERVEEELKDQESLLTSNGVTYNVKDLKQKLAEGYVFEQRYVDASEIARAIGVETKQPEKAPDAPAAESHSATKLVPLLVWQEKKDDDRTKASTLSAQEGFMIWMKASFVVGALVSAPWVFYQLWMFVASGLYHHERSYVYTFLPFSLGLFFAGAATAYLFVFQPVLDFLFGFNKWLGMHPDPRMNEWIGFVLLLPLGFGISFQLPLVMLFLERIGVLTTKDFIDKWRIAVLAIFIISAVLTPADPYSIFLMAVPLTFLYFGGILMMQYLPKTHRPSGA